MCWGDQRPRTGGGLPSGTGTALWHPSPKTSWCLAAPRFQTHPRAAWQTRWNAIARACFLAEEPKPARSCFNGGQRSEVLASGLTHTPTPWPCTAERSFCPCVSPSTLHVHTTAPCSPTAQLLTPSPSSAPTQLYPTAPCSALAPCKPQVHSLSAPDKNPNHRPESPCPRAPTLGIAGTRGTENHIASSSWRWQAGGQRHEYTQTRGWPGTVAAHLTLLSNSKNLQINL